MKKLLIAATSFICLAVTTNCFAQDYRVEIKINIDDERLSYEIVDRMEIATKKRPGCGTFDPHNGRGQKSRFAYPEMVGEDLYVTNKKKLGYCGYQARTFEFRTKLNGENISDHIDFFLDSNCEDLEIDSHNSIQNINLYCNKNPDPRYLRQLVCEPINDPTPSRKGRICTKVKRVNFNVKFVAEDER